MGKLIAVVSGKGGVGKTTVAGGLACALSGMGRSVLLLDGDFELGNIDLTLGISPPVQGLTDVLNGWTDACSAAVRPWGNRSLWFMELSVSPQAEEPARLAGLEALLSSMAADYDYVFVDCPAGVGPYFRHVVSAANMAVIVTTPDRTAVRDAERVAALLPRTCTPRLVVNRVRPVHILYGASPDIDTIIDRVGAQLLGVLPEDDRVTPLQNAGIPVVSDRRSQAGRSLSDTAKRLEGRRVPLPEFW
ncbi:MAG TPA: P-loop NTPase [Candidatus Acidoferrum sp.]|nr:P-loop NTPase [Candidatus Acidoferrum sp.]